MLTVSVLPITGKPEAMPVCLIPLDDGRPIVLDKAVVFIGRHTDCDVVLTRSRKISRKHCCIAQVDGRYVLRDLGSTNGVSVNGQPVRKSKALSLGDEVAIGDLRYELRYEEAEGRKKPRRAARRGPAAQGPPRKQASSPAELSRDVPVPIPESEGSLPVEPLDEDSAESLPLADDSDDRDEEAFEDVILLDDDSDHEDRDSHVGLLSE